MNTFLKTLSLIIAIAIIPISSFAIDDAVEIEDTSNLVAKISFDEVLKTAEEHSYDLKISDYNILISKQEVRGAKSEYFPKLYIGGGSEYTRNFRDARETTVMSISDAFINPYTRFQSVMGVTVSYNLFDFGVRGGNLKIAKEDVLLKELENKQTLQDMKMALLDIYSRLLITSKQINLNWEILALEEKNLEYYERLLKAKEISATELNDAKARLGTTKNKISELRSLKQESLNWLSFYTGEKYDINTLVIDEIDKPDFDVSSFKDYTKSVIWKIHEKNIKKKELELQVAKRLNYPKINLYGRYYLYGSDKDNYGKSFENIEPSNVSVGASLNMPVFDGFKNSANIKKTELELGQLNVERDKAIAEFMTKLANLRSNLIYLNEQTSENEKIIKELSQKEKSTKKLSQKRIITPMEYNNSKIDLINEQIELEKNDTTKTSIIKGIQILTEEI